MTLADDARRLVGLNDWIKDNLPRIEQIVGEFHDQIFNDVMDIVGNLHDPLVIDASVHTKHATELLEDYMNTIENLRKRINATGHKLARLS